jgi:hypothetical protein
VAPAAASAAGPAYAPLDQPGPPLQVPAALLRASLVCSPGVRGAKLEPVLLNPATAVTAAQDYGHSWEPELTSLGIPWCALTVPYSTLGDIQTSGEYIVNAIRTMHALAGRKMAILGHSQGGESMRWALRFWPDTRAMVDDVVGFAGANHGTTVLDPLIRSECSLGCAPAGLQQTTYSNFIAALNSRTETFAGISYTEIYSHTDEVVEPDTSSPSACTSCLHTGAGMITNVATQDMCPLDLDEHLLIGTIDPVAAALALDAIRHPGPADPARIPKPVCSELYAPGTDPVANTLAGLLDGPNLAAVVIEPAAGLTSGVPLVNSEPPPRCYVTASCTGATAPTLEIWKITKPRLIRAHHRARVHILIRTDEGGALEPVPGVTVTLAAHHLTTDDDGDTSVTIRPKHAGKYTITANRAGTNPARATITTRP